ncbi:hypothetical protein NDU88_006633 [Pleurodeles waltl]|uniref:Uncharacterized protein n=1 Tax=Pleurodeles waltl TaxID=8319 RepID=A0AAV7N2Z1_PLEWA|nr:hypothetical protein NDU88_006633 [Pleurodeles waltl]
MRVWWWNLRSLKVCALCAQRQGIPEALAPYLTRLRTLQHTERGERSHWAGQDVEMLWCWHGTGGIPELRRPEKPLRLKVGRSKGPRRVSAVVPAGRVIGSEAGSACFLKSTGHVLKEETKK